MIPADRMVALAAPTRVVKRSAWLLALTLLLCGCLNREVTYTIGADGSAIVQFVAQGDKADIEQGDLMPPKDVWQVKESEVVKQDGKKEYVYEATKSFAKVTDIPPNFALPATPHPGAYLQTPLQWNVRQEGGAKIYEFTLTYKARKWKEYWDLLSELVGSDLMELTKRYGIEKLTPEEQTSLWMAFARWQARLYSDRIAVALSNAKVGPEKRQAILKRIDDTFERIASKEEIAKILEMADETRNKALEDMAKRGRAAADAILAEELAGASNAETLQRVRDEVAAATLEWEITNDLGDENFTVHVQMPGIITRSNSEKVEGNRATWQFNSEKFRDADYVMTVTSRLGD